MPEFSSNAKKSKKSESLNPSMSASSPDHSGDEEAFYLALNHEIRRKIIQYLGENGIAGFSDFKRITGASTGTIYHHIDTINTLVSQNEKKKYQLTSLGEHAYRFLTQNQDSIESVNLRQASAQSDPSEKFMDVLLFKKLLQKLDKRPKMSIFISTMAIGLTAMLAGLLDINVFLFFCFPAKINQFSPTINNIYEIGGTLLGFLILFLSSEFLCRILFNKKGNWNELFRILGICYIPVMIYLGLYAIFNIIPGFSSSLWNKGLMIISQVWAMFLLSYMISIKKFLKFERGIIISVFINYGAFLFILLFQTSFE